MQLGQTMLLQLEGPTHNSTFNTGGIIFGKLIAKHESRGDTLYCIEFISDQNNRLHNTKMIGLPRIVFPSDDYYEKDIFQQSIVLKQSTPDQTTAAAAVLAVSAENITVNAIGLLTDKLLSASQTELFTMLVTSDVRLYSTKPLSLSGDMSGHIIAYSSTAQTWTDFGPLDLVQTRVTCLYKWKVTWLYERSYQLRHAKLHLYTLPYLQPNDLWDIVALYAAAEEEEEKRNHKDSVC
jgi:hypothetical protein